MKNSEEYLSADLLGQLTPGQIRIIDGMQFGSRLTLKEKVHEAAVQFVLLNASGGVGGARGQGGAGGGGGGDSIIGQKHKPWYTQWWAALVGIAAIVGAIFTVLQYYK